MARCRTGSQEEQSAIRVRTAGGYVPKSESTTPRRVARKPKRLSAKDAAQRDFELAKEGIHSLPARQRFGRFACVHVKYWDIPCED